MTGTWERISNYVVVLRETSLLLYETMSGPFDLEMRVPRRTASVPTCTPSSKLVGVLQHNLLLFEVKAMMSICAPCLDHQYHTLH